ncbi:MAG: helix-turn-helix domain-containing protein [Pseudomonadota bacterium]
MSIQSKQVNSVNTDSRRARSEATKNALMRAAEKLIAERGVENISIREIVSAAEQKNESALQYHFKNLSGLLRAIHQQRSLQVQNQRSTMLAELQATTPTPQLRQLCLLMIGPAFTLARNDLDFRRYVKAFGHELAISEASPLQQVSRHGGGGASGQQVNDLLRAALPHLEDDAYRARMEAAIMLCSASMYHQARQKNAFRGRQADLFLANLLDALVGLLGAAVSAEAKALHNPE